ncbi:hypothetical protein ATANTOWER_001543 [Ataeniobius toweri]|uniref:Uncharacterized protein n=1 Tax=Ataeniobius toweri TaxID=208326 RepID=A0ABU7AXK9_9TELE|nr:hypothetical protein [Ataeniobius toweri]
MITLEELQRSTAQSLDSLGESVHRKTTVHPLYKSSFYGRVNRRKPLLKESGKKDVNYNNNLLFRGKV